jgi:proteasome accessory factor B
MGTDLALCPIPMAEPQFPATADTEASSASEGTSKTKARPIWKTCPGGRVSAVNGGGTARQSERRRELRELFAVEYYKALRNPELRFKGPHELGADYRVSEKTIREDIKYLRLAEGLPVDHIDARGGYGFTEEVKALPGDEFTRGEYLALWMSVQSFEAWGGLPQQKKMPGIMRKLKAAGASMAPEQLKCMRERVTFKAGGFQAPVEQEVFDTVLAAVLERRELCFGYASLSKRREVLEGQAQEGNRGGHAERGGRGGKKTAVLVNSALVPVEPEARRVQPLHLLCWEYAWYLFAWDPARDDIRTFALGRMSGVTGTETHFTPEVKFNLRKELAKSFGITRGGKEVTVHLRFRKRAIPLVIERLWHASQEMIENEDGTLDLVMRLAVVPELVRWVNSWGRDVSVLAPTSLDDEVLEDARLRLEDGARRRGQRWVIG